MSDLIFSIKRPTRYYQSEKRKGKRFSRAGCLFCLGLLASMAAGCRQPTTDASTGSETEQSRYTIVATCAMVTDIVAQVAGDKAEVKGLMGTGVDPHTYNPTRSDVATLIDADVVFYSGLHLEGRMEETFTALAKKGTRVHAVTDVLAKEQLLPWDEEGGGHYDPHVWMDVNLWSQCVEGVATALGQYDPQNQAYYQENAKQYRKQLAELDAYARKSIATVPKRQRSLVTAHDAFSYFSRAYEIPVRSVQGITTDSQAGVADINSLVDYIVDRKIQAIFVESSVSRKNILAVIEGAASRGSQVTIGGELYSDAMGAPGTYEGTYIGMIDHNATQIARTLGGEAPERGFRGKLASKPERETIPQNK